MNRFTATQSFACIPSLVAGCVRSLQTKHLPVAKKAIAKRRVLFIDDESALTKICRLMLEKTDSFIVEEENLGSRALSTARKFRPDVIFLDIRLPDKDGHAIAAELRSDPALCDVPVVFWSGSIVRKRDVVANSHGCWFGLPKPCSHAELAELATHLSYQ